MSSSEIIVGCQYLNNLASKLRRTADDLRDFTHLPRCNLASAPKVGGAYDHLSGKWDERRGKLAEALETIACGFDKASEEFARVDSELAGKLEGD